MKALMILTEMLFLHIFADYHLQGLLAQMKQRAWWKKPAQGNPEMYSRDYRAALLTHSFEWSFVTMLPIFYSVYSHDYIFGYAFGYIGLCIANTVFHYCVDDAKANQHVINLIQDQRLHLIQIIATWGFWWAILGWN